MRMIITSDQSVSLTDGNNKGINGYGEVEDYQLQFIEESTGSNVCNNYTYANHPILSP